MALGTALKAFFATLFNKEKATRVEAALAGELPALPPVEKEPEKPKLPPKPKRNDAVSLLAALQREARFVDFIQEPLDGFSDAQIGAVAREVHRDCGKTIDRMFGIEPLSDAEENAAIELSEAYDPGIYRLTGNVPSSGPYSGQLAHHGWKTTRCEVPSWTGSDEAAPVVAPAEVEIG